MVEVWSEEEEEEGAAAARQMPVTAPARQALARQATSEAGSYREVHSLGSYPSGALPSDQRRERTPRGTGVVSHLKKEVWDRSEIIIYIYRERERMREREKERKREREKERKREREKERKREREKERKREKTRERE